MSLTKSFLVLLLLLAACGRTHPNPEEDAPPVQAHRADSTVRLTDTQVRNAGVQTALPTRRTLASELQVTGRVDVPPQNLVSVSMPLGGYIRSAGLLPGQFVRKGQVLATLEDEQYIQLQQDYLTARAKLVFTEKEYRRQQTLNQSKAASDKVFQLAASDNSAQQAIVHGLAEKLRLININPARLTAATISRTVSLYAPSSGYVSKVLVNPGKYVNPSDVLFELVNPTDIHLALTVFEKDLDKLFIGQSVLAFTNEAPARKHPARIILIGRDLSEDRSVQVHCHFDGYDEALVPGTFMNAVIEVQRRSGLALPEDAIVRYEGRHYAFVEVRKNQFRMAEVHPGTTESGYTELRDAEPLAAAPFAVTGAYSLLMALKNTGED